MLLWMKNFLFIIPLLFHFRQILCHKNESNNDDYDTWKRYVNGFIDRIDYSENQCVKDLSTLIKNYNSNRQFFDSWKISSTLDLWTLRVFQVMVNDMKCKLDRPNVTTKMFMSHRYCMYEINEPKLEDGFLFGYCMPNVCNDVEAAELGRVAASESFPNLSSSIMENEHLTCAADEHESAGWAFYSIITVLTVIGILSLVATMLDCPRHDAQGRPYAQNRATTFAGIFSVQNSVRKLTSRNVDTSIDSMHFMKAAAMLFLILCHMYFFTQIFADNLHDYLSQRSDIFFQQFFNGTYLMGTFFTISGALQAYSTMSQFGNKTPDRRFLGDLDEVKPKFSTVTALCLIVNRYFRIIPVYLYVMILVTYVFPHYQTHPVWHQSNPAVQCPSEIWKHVLFVNNLQHLQLCMPWTWYMAVEFQLFVTFVPIMALFIYRPRSAVILCLACVVATCTTRIGLILANDFPPALMILLPFRHYNENFRKYTFEIYTKPYTWAPSYAIGVLIGYLIHYLRNRKPFSLTIPMQVALWMFTFLALLWTPFGLFWNANGFKNVFYDGLYIGFSPVFWSLALGWIAVYAQCFSTLFIVKAFFKITFWRVLSNLTTGCYLFHLVYAFFFIYRYAVDQGGQPKINLPVKDLYGLYICTVLVSYIASFVMYMLIEGPAANFQAYLLKKFFIRLGQYENLKRVISEREPEKEKSVIELDNIDLLDHKNT